MFQIRPAQMEAFRALRRRQFLDRLLVRLGDEGVPLAGEALRGRVDAAVARAERYGVEREEDFWRFLQVAVQLGWDFDTDGRHPWASDLLEDVDFEPSTKVERLWVRAAREGRHGSRS